MYIRSECFRFIGSNVILLSSGFPTANVPYETRPPRKLSAAFSVVPNRGQYRSECRFLDGEYFPNLLVLLPEPPGDVADTRAER